MSQDHFVFESIGTQWQITSDPLSLEVREKIKKRIDDFDIVYSRFRPDSLVTTIAKQKGTYTLPDDAQPLFSLYEQLYCLSEGNFTPLIGQLLVDAGYDHTYSLQQKKLKKVPHWEDVMSYRYPSLVVKKPILLDFGAGGKGYLVDLIGKLLTNHDIPSFFIDAGGDILYKHAEMKKLRVGLEHPDDTTKVIGVVELEKGSICGSAGNRRAWGNYHHIFHPKKKTSVSKILAVWVVAESALVADALATCLFLSPVAILREHFTFSYAILHQNYSLESSADFPAVFY